MKLVSIRFTYLARTTTSEKYNLLTARARIHEPILWLYVNVVIPMTMPFGRAWQKCAVKSLWKSGLLKACNTVTYSLGHLPDHLSSFRSILFLVTLSRRTSALLTVFCSDLVMGMYDQMRGELTAFAFNIQTIAKTFTLIEFHFLHPLKLAWGHTRTLSLLAYIYPRGQVNYCFIYLEL